MRSRSGFTLLEMSIVLVVIATIIGGILTGQSLVRASKLRSVITQLNEYRSAVTSFKIKYDALPGDMPNATTYWGAANSTPSTCEVTASTGLPTCNGNGDGFVRANTNTATYSEQFRFWQQLANAGMIAGSYSGVAADSKFYALPGTNVPAGPLTNSGFSMVFGVDYYTDSNSYPAQYGNAVVFGANSANNATYSPIMAPAEAQAIDIKTDDGKPGTGNTMSYVAGSSIAPNCTTTNIASTALYNLSFTGNDCSLIFLLQPQS